MAGVDQVVYLQRDPDMADIGFAMSKVAFQQLHLKAHPVPGVALKSKLAFDIETIFKAECRRTDSNIKVPEFLCWDVCYDTFEKSQEVNSSSGDVLCSLFILQDIHVSLFLFLLVCVSPHHSFIFSIFFQVCLQPQEWADSAEAESDLAKALCNAREFLKNYARLSLGRNTHTK